MRRMASFTAFRQTCDMLIPSFFAFSMSSSSIGQFIASGTDIRTFWTYLSDYHDDLCTNMGLSSDITCSNCITRIPTHFSTLSPRTVFYRLNFAGNVFSHFPISIGITRTRSRTQITVRSMKSKEGVQSRPPGGGSPNLRRMGAGSTRSRPGGQGSPSATLGLFGSHRPAYAGDTGTPCLSSRHA
jgi:hypothetical protein